MRQILSRNRTIALPYSRRLELLTFTMGVGPEWPFPAKDFILKRLPSEVIRNYRPLTVGPISILRNIKRYPLINS